MRNDRSAEHDAFTRLAAANPVRVGELTRGLTSHQLEVLRRQIAVHAGNESESTELKKRRLARAPRTTVLAVLAALAIVASAGFAIAEIGDSGPVPRKLVGEGLTPDGFPFEVVATERVDGPPDRERRVPCLNLNIGGGSFGLCSYQHYSPVYGSEAFDFQIGLPSGFNRGAIVYGLVNPEVSRVSVIYGEDLAGGEVDEARVELFPLEDLVREAIEARKQVSYLLAFLPGRAGSIGSPLEVEAIAYDESGEEIDRSPIRWRGLTGGGGAVLCGEQRGAFRHACSEGGGPLLPPARER